LIEGEQHEIIWTNGDGATHNFNITSGSAVGDNGEVLEATETLTEQGATTSLEFTPQEEMEEYFCQPHPAQMRGPVELISPDEVRELVVHVEDENGEPLGAEVLVGDRHSFSNIAARPTPPEETSDEQAMARFDLLEDGEYDIEIWTYGHERITDTVTVDGSDRELVATLSPIEPGEPTETYSMRLEEGQWVGQSPDSIADETNPTLELEAGETYAVEWENAIGRHQPEGRTDTTNPSPATTSRSQATVRRTSGTRTSGRTSPPTKARPRASSSSPKKRWPSISTSRNSMRSVKSPSAEGTAKQPATETVPPFGDHFSSVWSRFSQTARYGFQDCRGCRSVRIDGTDADRTARTASCDRE